MARTRAQRRRHSLFITIALVVTLVVLVFARDISRAGHGSITSQRSENRSFAALANALITQENNFDTRLAVLLGSGSTFSRAVFDAQLNQLDQQLAYWSTAADLLRRPKLDHDINDVFADLTEARIDDYETLFASITRSLSLPAPSPGPDTAPSANPAQSLVNSVSSWNKDRTALRDEPGTVRLDALTNSSATLFVQNGVTALTASSSLAVVRGIGIAAIRVTPAPLPSVRGELLLPPVADMYLGVSVINTGFVTQSLTMYLSMTPSNGPLSPVRQTFHLVLAPLQSYAFVPKVIPVVPSERAVLDIRITGAQASPNLVRSKSFRVEMSPPGHT